MILMDEGIQRITVHRPAAIPRRNIARHCDGGEALSALFWGGFLPSRRWDVPQSGSLYLRQHANRGTGKPGAPPRMNSNFTDHAPIPANNLLTRIQWVLRDPSCSAEARLKRVDSLVSAASLNHVTESQHRARAGRASCKGGLAPWQIKRLHAFIAEGLSNSIRSLDLARLVGLSPHHTSVGLFE